MVNNNNYNYTRKKILRLMSNCIKQTVIYIFLHKKQTVENTKQPGISL